MKDRPILFSAPMVLALLAGTKTQTRRIVKLPLKDRDFGCELAGSEIGPADARRLSPYGKPGDRLWVRETWQYAPKRYCDCSQGSEAQPCDDWMNGIGCRSSRDEVIYRAEEATASMWRPSIFMPRWASRITLEVTDVRVERLQDISRGDAMAEGCPFPNLNGAAVGKTDPVGWYRDLWESINGAGSWETSPWVWVVEFDRVSQ